METLIVEMPTRIQNCLELLDTWLNSQKDNERERAMWCTARILGFTAKMNNFKAEIEFTRLGRLVRLLAVRCQDPVDNICFLSSQAVYNLYCILLQQKRMKNLLLCPGRLPLRPDHPHTLCPRRVNFKKFH
ncbi:maestro heat-like repeat family member 5 [Pteropus alecto]|uniref:maestro heat-like repeat family member 5 n=1 Tax=Pteropus alecto TaxID=9402 RepID=UPI000D533780|nr:maestro heat-like repeat family member 5 [Pteropus alecto]